MAFIDYMTHVVVLKRDTPGKDAAGGVSEAQAELGTYLARPENLSGTEVVYNAQNKAQVFDKIFVTDDCPVKELDTLELRDKDNNALISAYEVRRVAPQKQTQALHHLELDVQVHR